MTRIGKVVPVIVVLAAFGMAPGRSCGQVAFDPSIGWSLGVRENVEIRESVLDTRPGPVFALGLFVGGFRQEERLFRFGVNVTRQQVTTSADLEDGYSWRYHHTSVQLALEFAVRRNASADVLLEFGVGPSWTTSESVDGMLDDGNGWSNICGTLSPGVRVIVPVSGLLSFTVSARGNFYTDDAADTSPFKSGVMFLAGIELFAVPGPASRR